jgi:hypothetical protein
VEGGDYEIGLGGRGIAQGDGAGVEGGVETVAVADRAAGEGATRYAQPELVLGALALLGEKSHCGDCAVAAGGSSPSAVKKRRSTVASPVAWPS